MSTQSKLAKINVSNPKVWIVIGVTVAGIVILAETHRRRLNSTNIVKEDFGALIERFKLNPLPQPPPPAARLSLFSLTFAINLIEKTSKFGKYVPWALKVGVLAHAFVCVFVTHCRWNFVLEAISYGVPMICGPVFGDQMMNSRLVESVWKIGVRVEYLAA